MEWIRMLGIAYAVLLISNDGRPLLTETFQTHDNMPDNTLLSGLLATIQILSKDLTGSEGAAEKFQLRGLIYHLRSFGDFQVVISSSSESPPIESMDKIGWRFIKKYGEKIDQWKGNQSVFSEFGDEIQSIIKKTFFVDSSKLLDSSKKLDTISIFQLPKHLQQTALVLSTIQSGTAIDIARQLGEELDIIEEYLLLLQKQGYVGIYEKEGKQHYFTIS